MQRRWAAICLAFFLVMAAGAYGVSAVAEEPTIEMEGDTYQNNDTLQANGTTYTVTVDGGSGSLTHNETVENEESLENNSEVEYANATYNLTIESAEDPSQFALTEVFDVEAILQNDSQVENQTYQGEDGTQFVRYRDGSTEPLDEYLPEPEQETFAEGDTIQHAGESKMIDNVTAETVTLTWETEEEQSTTLSQGANVTIGDTTYVATFPEDGTVMLSEDVAEYQRQESNQEYFQDRLSGLNYVIIFSLVTSFLLATLSFMPRRG